MCENQKLECSVVRANKPFSSGSRRLWASLMAQQVKHPPAMQETQVWSLGQEDSIPRKGNGNPFQYSCLKNLMDIGAWWATVQRVPKSQTWLSDSHFQSYQTGSEVLNGPEKDSFHFYISWDNFHCTGHDQKCRFLTFFTLSTESRRHCKCVSIS